MARAIFFKRGLKLPNQAKGSNNNPNVIRIGGLSSTVFLTYFVPKPHPETQILRILSFYQKALEEPASPKSVQIWPPKTPFRWTDMHFQRAIIRPPGRGFLLDFSHLLEGASSSKKSACRTHWYPLECAQN